MKISIRRKLILFSFIILAGNALLGYGVYKSYQTMAVSARWVGHTQQVIDQSIKIFAVANDVETNSRGFVITKDSSFLEPLYASGKLLPIYTQQLKYLTRDNPIQQRRIDSLDFFLHKFLVFSYTAVELRSNEGLAKSVALISGKQNKYYTARIRQITNGIQKEEFSLLKPRSRANDINLVIYHRFSIAIFILMALFTILLLVAAGEILFHNKDKRKRAAELIVANKELSFQNDEKEKRASELVIANNELSYQNNEKGKRAAELVVANKELNYQQEEKGDRAAELLVANKELLYQQEEKGDRAAELIIANHELLYQNEEKEKRASELVIANKELIYQNEEREKRAAELIVANIELSFQNGEKEKRATELFIANAELLYQNGEKEKQAAELAAANEQLLYQNIQKAYREAELAIANKELLYQNVEKENRAAELITANIELSFQNKEKESRAAELVVANVELSFQNSEKEKRAGELASANAKLLCKNNESKLAETERVKIVNDLVLRNNDLEQFAYIVSHNLRAPIANIIGASTALEDLDLTVEDKETLNKGINRSVMKLDDVVRDLNHILDVKAEVNMNKELVTFSNLVDEIKISIKNMIDKNNVKIVYDFSAVNEVSSLKPYLHSIFYNLISNSVKYRRQNVPCIIVIRSIKIKNHIVLTIADNGMGINLTKNGEDVFGLYKRFHTNIEGKGMGLYMVKTQVETLGGRINIQSEENKGTEFKIEFAA